MVEVLLLVLLVLVILGVLESHFHRRKLSQIKYRIHVNGTRGKSSVTRLIASGLKESGLNVCAKTTGTLARMILPDGGEYPVFRPAKANVIEQIRIIASAVAYKADVLVIECMALQPKLQMVCEFMLVKATHGVITNSREDHLDVMGPGGESVPLALAGMVPPGKKLFTAERKFLDIFKDVCADRQTELIAVGDKEVDAITSQDMAGFTYVEHEENVALALKVCADLGVDRQTALRGMWKGVPDPGAMSVHKLDFFGKKMTFVNGFAANDPESTEKIWRMAIKRYGENSEKKIAIFNCRADRPDRSRQLAEVCANWPIADTYILIGTGTFIFAKYALKSDLPSAKLVLLENYRISEIFERVVEMSGKSSMVMGLGNIGGPGLDLVRHFRNRSHSSSPWGMDA